jgi:hypothetical protein
LFVTGFTAAASAVPLTAIVGPVTVCACPSAHKNIETKIAKIENLPTRAADEDFMGESFTARRQKYIYVASRHLLKRRLKSAKKQRGEQVVV